MKATIFHGPRDVRVESFPDPKSARLTRRSSELPAPPSAGPTCIRIMDATR